MSRKRLFKLTIVLSDSENSCDEDFHQSHPKKRSRLPDHQQEAGFPSRKTSIKLDVIPSLPSCSNDIFSDFNVIFTSNDEDYSIGQETSFPKRLRTSDIEADDAPEQCGFPHDVSDDDDYITAPSSPVTGRRTSDIEADDAPEQYGFPEIYGVCDDDDYITAPSSPVTDAESSGCLERSTSEEQPICTIQGCFIEAITSPTSPYVMDFQETKHELVTRLFKLYNSTVFENKLPESNIQIEWSNRLTVAAGYCINTIKDGDLYSTIKLSDKVCDSAERVRDILLHEMCHAACWHLNGVEFDGHGPFWVQHTEQATRVHPELPPVSVHHSYDIKYKYNYVCAGCGDRVGRFTKISEEKRHCKKCESRLVMENTS
ncbi:germ cell nuclear acidic-1 protein-like isoform X2 [Ranitomeya variabilis]|uniref:germ cell nuclear acidic-1 protein-like isoform X2 n=1 Tax=Ranitomeya variabilis TaxID=490064 RepID=UPI004055CDE0